MARTEAQGSVIRLDPWLEHRAKTTHSTGLHTIRDVAEACARNECPLPQPAIMQLAPRTWTDAGWMYTDEQLAAAVEIATELHRRGGGPPST
jgi:hypothetical protein